MKLRILALLPVVVVALGACSKKADPPPVPKVSAAAAHPRDAIGEPPSSR